MLTSISNYIRDKYDYLKYYDKAYGGYVIPCGKCSNYKPRFLQEREKLLDSYPRPGNFFMCCINCIPNMPVLSFNGYFTQRFINGLCVSRPDIDIDPCYLRHVIDDEDTIICVNCLKNVSLIKGHNTYSVNSMVFYVTMEGMNLDAYEKKFNELCVRNQVLHDHKSKMWTIFNRDIPTLRIFEDVPTNAVQIAKQHNLF